MNKDAEGHRKVGLIVLDEAHLAKNAVATDMGQPSKQGLAELHPIGSITNFFAAPLSKSLYPVGASSRLM